MKNLPVWFAYVNGVLSGCTLVAVLALAMQIAFGVDGWLRLIRPPETTTWHRVGAVGMCLVLLVWNTSRAWREAGRKP